MSEHDDTLLDEDLGDEEYDLGNDEEEALLADDYELERQNSYKGEEETDDVLDLGVTDALDDLDGEDENIEFSRGNTDKHSDNDFYQDGGHPDNIQPTSSYYEHDEGTEYANEREASHQADRNSESTSVNLTVNNIGKGDLREKLQKSGQKNIYVGNGQGMEDDDCEEARERRNRFQNERTMISPKMNNDIPDTLENVVTSEPSRMSFRGRGRGRGIGRGSRGGRFNVQNTGNFSPRFATNRPGNFDPPPACRPPLIETRPPCLLGVPSNVQNQQILYQQQANPQQGFQPFGPNGPMQGPPTQFVENRPQFNPGQFQGPMGPRPMGPRLPEYGLRGPMAVGSMQGPNYNCPPNHPSYHPPMPPPFQNPGGIMQENRPMQGNQGPLLQGNPGGGSLLGNPNMLLPGNPPNPVLLPAGNMPMPMQGFPRQQQPLPPSAQGPPPMQNLPPNAPQMPSQPSPFENRLPPFQEPQQFEGRNAFDARATFHPDQVPNSQFNNTMQPVPPQSSSNVSHGVSLPPGHKILINPHFRGTVQPANDARLVWDANQPQISHGGPFPQPSSSYQNQRSYNQPGPPQAPPQYQQNQQNYQQNKSDDPYAYFSDVWQENRPQKPQSMSPSKHYSSDNNYSRESNYSDSNKYKSDSEWDQRNSYQEDHRELSHQNYRERDLPLRTRNNHMQRSRTPPNTYRNDPYDPNHTQKSRLMMSTRGSTNRPLKRLSSDKELQEVNLKRNKAPGNRNLQEVRRIDTSSEPTTAKKDEDNDPEMQEYRKKMEEQKRLREKLLREKENRRKLAAMEKQNENARNDPSAAAHENAHQETKPVSALVGVVKDAVAMKARPGVAKGRGRPIGTQSAEVADRSNIRIVRTIQTIQTNDFSDTSSLKDNSEPATGQGDVVQTRQMQMQQPGTRRVVIQKPLLNSQKVATTIQKTVSNLQKNQGTQQKVSGAQVVQAQKVLQNQGNVMQKAATVVGAKAATAGHRMIAHKAQCGLQKTVINDAQKMGNAQQSQRIVLQKSPIQAKRPPEIKTNTVRLENLAASTSEAQIRRMCQSIGTIESIRMGEGNATIVFKTQSAAMVFHKKYQRKMLDLSLITVRLVPQSAPGSKVVTVIAKKS